MTVQGSCHVGDVGGCHVPGNHLGEATVWASLSPGRARETSLTSNRAGSEYCFSHDYLSIVRIEVFSSLQYKYILMASRSGVDFLWFYDSEEREHSPVKDVSTEEIARRPWKAFWPPRSKGNFDSWLASEYPEVLSWRFNPDKPFDQPWRFWLRSLQIIDEEDGLHLESKNANGTPGAFISFYLGLVTVHLRLTYFQQFLFCTFADSYELYRSIFKY